ncbi:MAG TPA: YbhB/YbcL family Raf kinase inhibitor-like protein [Geobacteraceae bacterium]|jgi:Raf kinase inhibitor-like YbhB/YbcL family protein|nr:YbhB/YbcL family Raf kinase inhibitor-like protein [Geobacteraceae bacterium]
MKTVLLLILAAAVFFATGALGKEVKTMEGLRISSPAFANSGGIPAKYTCDGADESPPLSIEGVPAEAKALALIVDDPDAPVGTWVHWVVWNIPPETRMVGENALPPGAAQGKNDWGRNSYGGPCPPSGSHRYFFKLYALDTTLALDASTTKKELEKAMKGHVVAQAETVGVYRRR